MTQEEWLGKLKRSSEELRQIFLEIEQVPQISNDWQERQRQHAIEAIHTANEAIGWAARYIESFVPKDRETEREKYSKDWIFYLDWTGQSRETERENGCTIAEWMIAGFSPKQMLQWEKAGAFYPVRVKEMESVGITPEAASKIMTSKEWQESDLPYFGYSLAYMACNGDIALEEIKRLLDE